MKKSSSYLWFSFCLFAFSFGSFGLKALAQKPDKKYEVLWQRVDSMRNKDLPESALKVVEQIYKLAATDNNQDQLLKATFVRVAIKKELPDFNYKEIIASLEGELKVQKFPNTAILQSLLAQIYWNFYEDNRWNFYNRSKTINFSLTDINTWSLAQITEKAISLHLASLQKADELKKIPVSFYKEIIEKGNVGEKLRPTLFDFVAYRAVRFFSNTESTLAVPADQFVINDKKYFAPAESFANQKFETTDTLSLTFHAIRIYQEIIKFHLSDKSPLALMDADFERLLFVKNQSILKDRFVLYLEQLENLAKKYPEGEAGAEAQYQLAYFYYGNSSVKEHPFKEAKKKMSEICRQALVKYPKSSRAVDFKSFIAIISQKEVSFNVENVIIPASKFSVKINYQNLDTVYVKVIECPQEFLPETNAYLSEHNYQKVLAKAKTVINQPFILPHNADFETHSSEIVLNGLPNGEYLLFVSNNPKFAAKKQLNSYIRLFVSNLTYAIRELGDLRKSVRVYNYTTGEPVEGAKIEIQVREKKRMVTAATYITDKEGLAEFQLNSENYSSNMIISKERDVRKTTIYRRYNGYERNSAQDYIFTDRAIYRPGQTVYYKGIALKLNGTEEILARENRVITFVDANGKEITKTEHTTNDYGSFSGTFTIPTGLLNGRMTLRTNNGSHSISVEEYVRPKFEVKFDNFEKNYRLGDSIVVTGKAQSFTEAPVTDAKVTFRVQRQPKWFGWYYRDINRMGTEIANGTVTTNDKGVFEIRFKAKPDETIEKNENLAFTYQIWADVTDISGETQKNNKSITIGYTDLDLSTKLTGELSQTAKNFWQKIEISTKNLNGAFTAASGEIKISKLKTPQLVLKNRKWEAPDKPYYTQEEWYKQFPGNEYKNELEIANLEVEKGVFDAKFNTAEKKEFAIANIENWALGAYMAEITSKDAYGSPVTAKYWFTLVNESKKELAYPQAKVFKVLTPVCEPGDTAKILFGSGYSDVKALFEVEWNKKIVLKEWLTLNKEQKVLNIPIKEEYRGNICIFISFVKDGCDYNFTEVIKIPFTNKELKFKYSTFRDKLQPGDKEEWKVTISGQKKDKLAAEMMAALYDASLDAFAANSWEMNPFRYRYSQLAWDFAGNNYSWSSVLTSAPYLNWEGSTRAYDALNDLGVLGSWQYHQYSRKAKKAKNGDDKNMVYSVAEIDTSRIEVVADEIMAASEEPVMLKATASGIKREKAELNFNGNAAVHYDEVNDSTGIATVYTNGALKIDLKNVKARTNLNETAFFYPTLYTNDSNEVVIKFTAPEALTRWKFMGLAHTKELQIGTTENTMVTAKTLMVSPNPPRFFRDGDEMVFPVKITNMSDKEVTGVARIEFFDAATMKPIKGLLQEVGTQNFTTASKGNSLVSWKIKIPEGLSAIDFKVVASTGEFSDGEERIVPVIPNKMLVTESLPLYATGKQSKEFRLEKLINSKSSATLRHEKLTLEFTSNPAWYAVQALPYLMEYPYECSEQVFNRFYANTLASYIANSNPKIQKVFETWKAASPSAFLSNLEKNQELKALVLEETPWVMAAGNESEAKKRIGLLFDLNKMSQETSTALNKLIKKQRENGGFPWFDGMDESLYITQYIVAGLGHLKQLKVVNPKEDSKLQGMLLMAISFIDSKMANYYQEIKRYTKNMDEYKPGYSDAYYLYCRSFFSEIPVDNNAKEAFNFYKKQTEKYYQNLPKLSQAQIALAFKRWGNMEIPQMVTKSLKEYSTTSEEMGMYWKDNQAGYYWHEAPIEFQALMVELYDEVTGDVETVENLKTWLLKQKQTQNWGTTKATADAVYALLRGGKNWLENDELATLKVGGTKLDPEKMENVKVEAGTGYFKTSWAGSEIKPEMGKVTVTKNTDGIAWGSLYWQYFEQLDKITPHETPLKLQKKLFIERLTPTGPVIEPMTEKAVVKVGDKVIVRIELRVDRDMEYVHMKDMRAAGFEPINVFSRYKYQDGLGYYETTKDAATNFFISYLAKGTYVFEYPLRATLTGNFSNGITTIQCMYAPEFTSHSEGIRVKIEK
jgi:uncharacterized protein YfaS (alpha-2-macroglobulin family)